MDPTRKTAPNTQPTAIEILGEMMADAFPARPVYTPSLPVEPSPAEVHPKAPAGVRDALAGLPVDVADALASVAELAVREVVDRGHDWIARDHGYRDALYGAAGRAAIALGRGLAQLELDALEAAIRWHLDHPGDRCGICGSREHAADVCAVRVYPGD